MTRLQGLMEGLRPRIPESLLAGRGWDRLLDRVGDLPAVAASDLCGFELKLDDPAPAVDFSIAVVPGPVAEHLLANSDATMTSTERWAGMHLTEWSKHNDWLMLAYDIVGVPEGRQVAPAVYVRSGAKLSSDGPVFNPDRLAETLGSIRGGGGGGLSVTH